MIGVYHGGTRRGLTVGGNEAKERVTILSRLGSLLNLGGAPRCVRSCSVSRATKRSSITNVVIFGNNGPCHGTCGHFSVGDFSNGSSCHTVGRILAEHFSRCRGDGSSARNFNGLPSLVLLSNNIKRIRTMRPILHRFKLGVPLFNVMGSGQRHAHTVSNSNNRVTVGSGQRIFALISRVRGRMRQFSITCRRRGRTGHKLSLSLARVRNIKRGETSTLLGCFGAVATVGGTRISRLSGTPKVASTITRGVCSCCEAGSYLG